jgi:hypothetical protein
MKQVRPLAVPQIQTLILRLCDDNAQQVWQLRGSRGSIQPVQASRNFTTQIADLVSHNQIAAGL